MAIRDRVTVKTKDGTVNGLVVTKQGGSIETEEPKPPKNPNWVFEVQNKEGAGTGLELIVPADEVIYIFYDKEPKTKK